MTWWSSAAGSARRSTRRASPLRSSPRARSRHSSPSTSGGCVVLPMLLRGRQRAPATRALAVLPVAPGLATGLGGSASVGVLWKILAYFAGASLFVFGSGLAIVPFLYGGVVQQFHWLTERQFIDAVAVSMITPGPVVLTVAFIGYLVAGLAGATLAAIGVFLPVYLIT